MTFEFFSNASLCMILLVALLLPACLIFFPPWKLRQIPPFVRPFIAVAVTFGAMYPLYYWVIRGIARIAVEIEPGTIYNHFINFFQPEKSWPLAITSTSLVWIFGMAFKVLIEGHRRSR